MIDQKIRSYRDPILICLGLALIVLLPFYQTGQFDFVHFDDRSFIRDNINIQTGFNRAGIAWAFTSLFADNWHPLTWLSLMLDYTLYGLNPGGYHWTNVLIHLANTILLFLIFARMTGATGRCAFLAALFAVHPLHVESVAWIMERKDVLSTLFGLLTIGFYASYAKHPSPGRYGWVCVSFVLGLMSKPMLVTVPFILLLLDYWPLHRFRGKNVILNRHLLMEKIPLFVLSAAAGAVTVYAQGHSGALQSFEAFPLSDRVINAVIAYAGYAGKMLWPVNLAFFYPYPLTFSFWSVFLSGAFLTAASLVSFRLIRIAPYLAMGWLWYLVALFPVCGIIQTGEQAMADRYTYIPMIGLFMAVSWGIPDLLSRRLFYHKSIMPVFAGVILAAFTMLTFYQTGTWKDSRTLFEHAIAVTEGNYVAQNNLGRYDMEQGRFPEAAGHFSEAVRIKPGNVKFLNNLGVALFRQRRYDEAVPYYLRAIALSPRFADSYYNAADAYFFSGKEKDAFDYYQKALFLKPGSAVAENNVATILIRQGKMDEAAVFLQAAIRHQPGYAEAHNNLGVLYARMGRRDDAVAEIRQALRIDPGYAEARDNLKKLMVNGKRSDLWKDRKDVKRAHGYSKRRSGKGGRSGL